MKDLTISRGAGATKLLADPAFRAQWRELCARCAWSTSYQSPAFAGTWYRVYAGEFEPVIVTARNDSSALCGLLCLAVSSADGALVVAGGHQAEYQSWVSDPECDNEFAAAALRAVQGEFPTKLLEFRYLPPATPLDWLGDPRVKSRFVLSKKPRPLLRFAQVSVDSLSKTNNKKRLKELKKVGEIEFRRLTSGEELAAIFDDIADFYDVRLGAMHGFEPFARDPLKRSFQFELMKEPGLLHVTILKAGNLLASAHLNVCDGKQLHLNLISYNPILAKHSPGKFHIHLLSQMLIAEGYEELDLTPGGDPYKERFANAHDTAFVLSFPPTRLSRLKGVIAARGESWARIGLRTAGVYPARAREAVKKLREVRAGEVSSSLVGRLRDQIHSQHETMLYARRIATDVELSAGKKDFRRDALHDLLAYRQTPNGVPRKRFLFDAMNRLAEGQHLYSCVREQRLIHVGWVMERPSEVYLSRIHPGLELPADCALITDMRACGPAHEPDLGPECLTAMLSNLSRFSGIRCVMMAVPAGSPQIQLLQASGFSWERSLFVKTTFARVRRWTWQATAPSVREPQVSPAAAMSK